MSSNRCPECYCKNGKHLPVCSHPALVAIKKKETIVCEECGYKNGKHFHACSHYAEPSESSQNSGSGLSPYEVKGFRVNEGAEILYSEGFNYLVPGSIVRGGIRIGPALFYNDLIIPLNKKTVKHFSRLGRKGISALPTAVLHVAFGHLVGGLASEMIGRYNCLLYVEFIDDTYFIMKCDEGYYHSIKRHCKMVKMDEITRTKMILESEATDYVNKSIAKNIQKEKTTKSSLHNVSSASVNDKLDKLLDLYLEGSISKAVYNKKVLAIKSKEEAKRTAR